MGKKGVLRFTVADREVVFLAVNLGRIISDSGNSKDLLKGRAGSAALPVVGGLLLKMLRGQDISSCHTWQLLSTGLREFFLPTFSLSPLPVSRDL